MASLRLLDWSWLYSLVEKQVGTLTDEDRPVVLDELLRFIAVKIAAGDVDETNNFAPTGVVAQAFHTLLLHPFFCANIMRMLQHPGKVLSHVPHAEQDDRVRKYLQHYKEVFGGEPPCTLPSGKGLWPGKLLQGRGQKRKEPPSSSSSSVRPPSPVRTRHGVPGCIIVKRLTGATLTCSFPDFQSARVVDLVNMIQEKAGIRVDRQVLIWAERTKTTHIHAPLACDSSPAAQTEYRCQSLSTLASHELESGSILHLAVKVGGR